MKSSFKPDSGVCRSPILAFLSLAAIALFMLHPAAHSQMVSPSIDPPEQPFSYFAKPTDEIGVMDGQAATEVTPEGYLYTGFGELMFFAGPQMTPVEQRIRTLEKGYLPIIRYTYHQDGIAYSFTMFASTLDGTADGCLVNFIRVSLRNETSQPLRADFGAGIRYQNESNTGTGKGDHRFRRPARAQRLGQYHQIGEDFNPDWIYRFDGNQFLRDNKVLYVFPEGAQQLQFTLRQRYNNKPDLTPRSLQVLPTTPVGIVEYSRMLKPDEETSLVFKMPVTPMAPGSDLSRLHHAEFNDYLGQTIRFWDGMLAGGLQIELPEEKPVDTFKASLVYDLIARDKVDGNFVQTVNKLQYHGFYLRDAADIIHMYDITGYPQIARQALEFFAQWQRPDGNFVSQEQQYDGWGEALWAYGQHYRMTHDRAFAGKVLPLLVHAVAWLHQARLADPLHLMPASDVRDNEYVPGHLTGYNFLALAGLKNAVRIADDRGATQEAADFRKEYADYRAAFLDVLDRVTRSTGGYIPPALDGQTGGQDWGNLLSVYPERILELHDPRVTATLKATQQKYQEGIMTYGDGRWLHHYLTIKNTLTEVLLGDQEQAIREFYALLLHTSSTHAGFEYAIRPWGNRDFEDNLAPHGWFAAEYRTLLRNMLVREDERTLHLLSVISPQWIGKNKRIAVRHGATEFGEINYELQQEDEDSAVLRLDCHWRSAPEKLIIHLPWFMNTSSVSIDGKASPISEGNIVAPPGTREIRIHWQPQARVPVLSYQQTVDAYKAEYRKRYESYLHEDSH